MGIYSPSLLIHLTLSPSLDCFKLAATLKDETFLRAMGNLYRVQIQVNQLNQKSSPSNDEQVP
jgi:hypothetical protein